MDKRTLKQTVREAIRRGMKAGGEVRVTGERKVRVAANVGRSGHVTVASAKQDAEVTQVRGRD